MERIACVITAAGSGKRMGSRIRKQFLPLQGAPLLKWTFRAFLRFRWLQEIVLVVPAEEIQFVRTEIVGRQVYSMDVHIVPGAKKRQDSVFRGLQAVHPDTDLVLIHDGVRPFVQPTLVERLIHQARTSGAAIPGIPARDTLKQVQKQTILRTVERQHIWQVQTPQVFRFSLIFQLHQQAQKEGFYTTDDAGLLEWQGRPVHIVPGDPYNIKITTPEDLQVAERLLSIYFPEETTTS